MTPPLTTDQTDAEQEARDAAQREELAAAPPADLEPLLRRAVSERAARILEHPVEDDSNFLDLGVTSLKALELNRALMTLTGLEIPLVAIIEHPTPAALAGYVAGQLADAGPRATGGE